MSEQPQQNGAKGPGKKKRSSVFIYLAVLFGAAFLMLLLAYFVQQRNSNAASGRYAAPVSAQDRYEYPDERDLFGEDTPQNGEER